MKRPRAGVSEVLGALVILALVLGGFAVYSSYTVASIRDSSYSIVGEIRNQAEKQGELITFINTVKREGQIDIYLYNYGYHPYTPKYAYIADKPTTIIGLIDTATGAAVEKVEPSRLVKVTIQDIGSSDKPNILLVGASGQAYQWSEEIKPDFAVSLDSQAISIAQGSSKTVSVTVTPFNGYSKMVTLSSTGMPTGVAIIFNPDGSVPTYTSTATIDVTSGAAPGSYPITIKGTGQDGETRSTILTLAITQASTITFTVRVEDQFSNTVQGVQIQIDSLAYVTSSNGQVSVNLESGSHTIEVQTPYSPSTGTRHVFNQWSDGATSNPRTVTATSSTTYTAKTTLQYYMTIEADPSAGGTVSPPSGWHNSGTSVPISANANPGYAFSSWSGSGTGSYTGTMNPATITILSPIMEKATFQASAAQITFQQNGLSSDASGAVLTVDGLDYGQADLPKTFSWSQGTVHSYTWSSTVLTTVSGKRNVWTSTSGLASERSGSITVSGSGSITGVFEAQYYLAVSSLYDSPTGEGWYDDGSTASSSISSPVSGGSGIRYVATGFTGTGSAPSSGFSTSVSFTISSPSRITWNWKTQYLLTMQASPLPGGSTSPPTGSQWKDGGSSVTISATANGGYTWNSWSGSGAGAYNGVANPATITIDGPITQTANFLAQYSIQFDASGLSADVSGGVLAVDGTTYAYTQIPVLFTWVEGSVHTYAFTSPLSAGSGKQYVWVSTTGLASSQSGSITVSSSGSITGAYKTQYYLTMIISPPAGGTVSPGSGWRDAGSIITISASPNSRYSFVSWIGSGSGSYSGQSNPASITMSGPITETAEFTTEAVGPITFFDDDFQSGTLEGWAYTGASGYTLTLDSANGQPSPSALISGDNFNTPINGMQKTVDVSTWKGGALTLSYNWRASSEFSGSTVTNSRLIIEDADTGQSLYEEYLIFGGVYDTGWRSYSKDISSYVNGHARIRIILSLHDSWSANWNQKNWYDNIVLKTG